MPPRTRKAAVEPAPLATRADCRRRFDEIIEMAGLAGWHRIYTDTLGRTTDREDDRNRLTIRHHYTAGTWELYIEPDARWNHRSRVPAVKLTVGKPLPALSEALLALGIVDPATI